MTTVLIDPNNEARVIRDLIAVPLRIAAFATRLGVRLTRDVVGGAASVTWRVIEAALEPDGGLERSEPPAGEHIDVEIEFAPRTSDAEHVATPTPASEVIAPLGESHLFEEPEFVEAYAEPGAEEGAGASVHIQAPWKGYSEMTAAEVISRLADATREELATVELYERAHRARRTVLAAAEQSLGRATAAARHQRESGDGVPRQ